MARIPSPDALTFARCEEVLTRKGSGTPLAQRKMANNTYLRRTPTGYALRLHDTDIVTWDRTTGNLTFDMGGWDTMTTRARLDQFAPGFRFYRDKGITYVITGNVNPWSPDGKRAPAVPFFDGMVWTRTDIDAWEHVITSERAAEAARQIALTAQIKREVTRYVKGFRLTVTTHDDRWNLGDTSGDCLLCKFGHHDAHVLMHVREDYHVPTLWKLAAGHRNAAHGDVRAILFLDTRPVSEALNRGETCIVALDDMGRAELKRYLLRAILGPGGNRPPSAEENESLTPEPEHAGV